MNLLLEILLDILQALIPWGGRHEDRSIVGDSPFDKKARFWKYVLIGVVLAALLGLGVWLWFQ